MLVHLGHSCPACGAEAICRPYPLCGVRGESGCETEWSRLVKGLYQLTLDQPLDQLVALSLLFISLVRGLNMTEEEEKGEEAFMVGNKALALLHC